MPVAVDDPGTAGQVARAEKEAKERPARPRAVLDAPVKPEPVLVAPTRDNLPGPRPQYGKKKAEPAKPFVRQGYRELPGDAEARERVHQQIHTEPLTVEEQGQADPARGFKACTHGRNVYRCSAVKCKIESGRA